MEENKKVSLEKLNHIIAEQHGKFKNFLLQYKTERLEEIENGDTQKYDELFINNLKEKIKNKLKGIIFTTDKIDFENNEKLAEYLSDLFKSQDMKYIDPQKYTELFDLFEELKKIAPIKSIITNKVLSQHLTRYNQILEIIQTQIDERNQEIEQLGQEDNEQEKSDSDITYLKEEINVLTKKQSEISSIVTKYGTIEDINRFIEVEISKQKEETSRSESLSSEEVQHFDESKRSEEEKRYHEDIFFAAPPAYNGERQTVKDDIIEDNEVPPPDMSEREFEKITFDNNHQIKPILTIDVSNGIATFEREGSEPITFDLDALLDNRQERARILGDAKELAYDKEMSLAKMGIARDRYNPVVLALLTEAKEKELLINYLSKANKNINLNNLGFEYIVKIERGDKLSNRQFSRLNKALIRDGEDLNAEKELKGVKHLWLKQIGYKIFGTSPALPEVSSEKFEKNPQKEELRDELEEATFNNALTIYTDKLKQIEKSIRSGKHKKKEDGKVVIVPYTDEELKILELQKKLINSKIRDLSGKGVDEKREKDNKKEVFKFEMILAQARSEYYNKRLEELESKGEKNPELERKIEILQYIQARSYINYCNVAGIEELLKINPNAQNNLEFAKRVVEETKERISLGEIANFERKDVITSYSTEERKEAKHNLEKSVKRYTDVKKYGSRTKLGDKLASNKEEKKHRKETKKKIKEAAKEPDNDDEWEII